MLTLSSDLIKCFSSKSASFSRSAPPKLEHLVLIWRSYWCLRAKI